METKTFADIKESEGLVLLGCSDPDEWEKGVLELLDKERLAQPTDFLKAYQVKTSGGRTDVVIPFKPVNAIQIGKLAIWRLKFGDCSWISDYKVNYAKQHNK